MKKIYTISAVLLSLLSATAAQAKSGPYVGIDALYSNTKHTLTKVGQGSYIGNGLKSTGYRGGVGVNLGYKAQMGSAYLAPELFFDYLNNSAKDFAYKSNPAAKQDSMEINNRYGARLNIGYNVFARANIFVNAGLTSVRYIQKDPSTNSSYGAYKTAPIYGIGMSYDLNDQITLKTSYDYQKFNTRYLSTPYRDSVLLNTFKLGMNYSF